MPYERLARQRHLRRAPNVRVIVRLHNRLNPHAPPLLVNEDASVEALRGIRRRVLQTAQNGVPGQPVTKRIALVILAYPAGGVLHRSEDTTLSDLVLLIDRLERAWVAGASRQPARPLPRIAALDKIFGPSA